MMVTLIPLVYVRKTVYESQVVLVLRVLRPCLIGETTDETYESVVSPGVKLVGHQSEKAGLVPSLMVVTPAEIDPDQADRARLEPFGVWVDGRLTASVREILELAMTSET